MYSQLIGAISVFFLIATTTCALVQNRPGDWASGRAAAERLCSNCHVVSPDNAPSLRGDVPSFMTIARLQSTTPERLAGAIIMPHPAMPGVALTRAELRDVIADIMSLQQ